MEGSSRPIFAKMSRPALVWSELVTVACTVSPMALLPSSMTIMVPSGRKPTPWPSCSPARRTRTLIDSPGARFTFAALARSLRLSDATPWIAATRASPTSVVRMTAGVERASSISI